MISNNNPSGTNQRPNAFTLGNIISDEHIIKGINIFPNPPIKIGIIIKNIIKTPWKVINALYWRDEHTTNPGNAISNRITNDSVKPIIPPIKPDIIYITPIHIWLVLVNILVIILIIINNE